MTPRHRQQHMTREQLKKRYPKSKTEPALIRGAVVAVLALLVHLGFTWADVDSTTKTLIVAVVSALLALGQALWTRYAVTPDSKVVARVSVSQGRVVLGDAGEAGLVHTDPLTNSHTIQPDQGEQL